MWLKGHVSQVVHAEFSQLLICTEDNLLCVQEGVSMQVPFKHTPQHEALTSVTASSRQ